MKLSEMSLIKVVKSGNYAASGVVRSKFCQFDNRINNQKCKSMDVEKISCKRKYKIMKEYFSYFWKLTTNNLTEV